MKNQTHNKIFFIVMGLVFFIPIFSWAQSTNDIQSVIEQKNNEIKALESEIESYQNQANQLSSSANDLQSVINTLNLNEKKLSTQIRLTQKNIEKTTNQLVRNEQAILQLGKGIQNNTSAIGDTLKIMYQNESTSLVEVLLANKGVSEMFSDIFEAQKIGEKLHGVVIAMQKTKTTTESAQINLQKTQAELLRLKKELADQEKIIETERAEKAVLLRETKNKESNYRKLVEERQKRKTALDNEIREYESKLKFSLDKKSLPAPGSAVLSWPVDNVLITQKFGKTSDSGRLYTSGSHSGVDFRATVGTPVYAVADGVVEGTGDTDLACNKVSFGKWVFIRHDNGLASTYGHLSLIKAVQGSRVNRGDLIAYSGNTGRSTGPHLHLTIYASMGIGGDEGARVSEKPSISCSGKILRQPLAPVNAYLDPLLYFPRATTAMYKESKNE